MKTILILGVVVAVVTILIQRMKLAKEKQEYVGVSKASVLEKYPVIKEFYNKVKRQAEYTDKSLNRVTTYSLVLMIPGGVIGVIFKNMELGLLLSLSFSTLPFVHLFLLERKKQKIILKETVPFLTKLDWAYANHHSVRKALNTAQESCPSLVKAEYEEALKKISNGALPSETIRELGERTRSPIFLILSGTLAAQEERNDIEAFRESLNELQNSVVKSNNRLSKIDSNLNKKKVFLLVLGGLCVLFIFMTSKLVNDPIEYFSNQGSTAFLIGSILMLVPFSLYLLSALRRRF